MIEFSPICLFTYNRLKETQLTVEALKKNYLARDSRLIIFSDGAKKTDTEHKVQAVRDYLKTIDGFNTVEIIESSTNKGLADSIISGVSEVVNKYGTAIVLEDDLVTSPNFLTYMNQCLKFYENDDRIISICGYGLKIKKPISYKADVYLYGRSSSWGWATWKDRWNPIDWEVKDWETFKKDKKAIKTFNKNGSDMYKMLKSVIEGTGSSWAIRLGYEQFKKNKYSIIPFKSLVDNIGFTEEGTNTKFRYSRFKIIKEDPEKIDFLLESEIVPNIEIEKSCYKYHSIPIRIYSRLRYVLGF